MYYVNHITEATSWERPVDPPTDVAPPLQTNPESVAVSSPSPPAAKGLQQRANIAAVDMSLPEGI